VRQHEVRDTTSSSGNPALLDVGPLSTRLLLGSDVTDAYACIPIAHVIERRADQQVVLDEKFIPTVLRARSSSRLASFTTELVGLLHQRGDMLAGRVTGTSRGGTAEIADFLMLEAINRYEPLLTHYADAGILHPEELFRIFISAAGELATFTTTSKRPPALAAYRHELLQETFEPVMKALRECLSVTTPQRAIQIPLEQRKYGISVAIVNDTSLYKTAMFVLAARADVAAEELRKRFPAQLKVGPVEKIGDLVNFALPGVPVNAVPVAPRQIPFHQGFAYFELDQTHELWAQLSTSGGLAIHVAGDFPGLATEMWAIRE
jgi:type VI secretion system protein ImpJ